MASESSRIRAADADRDRVASLLQEHLAAGRLTEEEFGERVDAALHARTLGELDELLADLPHADLRDYRLPDADLRRPPPRGQLPDAGINRRPDRLYNPGGARPACWGDSVRQTDRVRVNSRSARGLLFSHFVP